LYRELRSLCDAHCDTSRSGLELGHRIRAIRARVRAPDGTIGDKGELAATTSAWGDALTSALLVFSVD